MSKSKAITTTPPDELALIQARFRTFQTIARTSAMHTKLAAYFCGLEVQALADFHGVRQGAAATSASVAEVGTWSDFVEAALNVPYRTAQRYRAQFNSIATAQPEAARKLNEAWKQMHTTKALTAGGDLITSSQLSAEALHTLCTEADQWGLDELFQEAEKQAKDAGGSKSSSSSAKAKREALINFWHDQLTRRIESDEYLRLPATTLESVATHFEQAAKKARAILKQKGGR